MVDSGALMHMMSRKDFNSAELATSVTTASCEVQTHEEATVYVREVDIFLTLKIL